VKVYVSKAHIRNNWDPHSSDYEEYSLLGCDNM
jgi:hypothetical protein